MRVTSDLFVASLTRRVFAEGGYAAVLRRGAREAGAVFVIARGRDGTATLLGPAAQTDYDAAKPSERLFSQVVECQGDDGPIDERLQLEERFDPDFWVVEIEPAGRTEDLITIR
ncbi:DUF1491 family protein [Mesorhizobium xinjiangense]|uniref:DUF1491 family protein n=1 Tax=Mesorhizobium xinjiangense TaxID=2678685 RepID=UPI0012EE2A3E|nr:DUF1491 family protein [Mesorhizobium xinjiangense]